jgi:hypothetical protein
MKDFDLRKYIAEGKLLKEDCGCGCNDCSEKTQPQSISLNLEEKKAVVKMVMESYKGVTLTEAKSNENIREVIKIHLEFYRTLKETINVPGALLAEGGVLSIFGGIKDFLTGSDIVRNLINWLKEKVSKLVNWLSQKFSKYIPEPVKKSGDWIGKAAKSVSEWGVWILEAFTYKGLARLFAMLRYRKLRPTEEQKACMVPIAKKIYVTIVASLVVAYLIKILPGIIAFGKLTGASFSQASLTPLLTPIGNLFTKAGVAGASKVIGKQVFSAASAAAKAKAGVKKSDLRGKSTKDETIKPTEEQKSTIGKIKEFFTDYSSGWKEAWYNCKSKNYEEEFEKDSAEAKSRGFKVVQQ